ncbi:uncharacterized protein LOC123297887 [Chrysoperla carnea]|uniref:uncharacterized protein LOC123297887 n=1 Tax=Chrysoperla carnea TaxID=189513 RepID=UPI001D083C60|nr:uncharacterized protein LOC123297887 [Chrysoperla carnea]
MDFSSQWISNEFKTEHFLQGFKKFVLFNNTVPVNGSLEENVHPIENTNGSKNYGIVLAGLFLLLLISNKLKTINIEFLKELNVLFKSINQNLSALLCLIVFVVILPIIGLVLGCFLFFRLIVFCILKLKFDDQFIGLLAGTDCIWALEDQSLCIITGLGVLEVPESETPFEIYHKIKERVYNRLFSHPIQCPKLFYKRQSFMGYFYWEYPESIHVEDHVRQMPNLGRSKQITKDTLDSYISQISNAPMYKNHTKSWEILIGKQTLEDDVKKNSGIQYYPIIFRVHHTLGDGYALVQLLLEAIAETNMQMQNNEILRKYKNYKCKAALAENKKSKFESYMKLFYVPKLLFSQIIRKADENILHNTQLSGEKLVTWWSDNANGEMLNKVKRVQHYYSNIRFCDVIISAISVSFSKYFQQKSVKTPNTMTLVIPVRAEMENIQFGNKIELTNRFTVGFVDAPLNFEQKSIQQLEKVHIQTERLRNSLEFAVNYWLIKVLAGVLPSQILKVLLYSEHATAISSNIPGPSKIILSDDMCLNDLIFWIPNRGRTGVGISILTYGNRLQMGISVDKVFISDPTEVKSILNEIINEIEHLDSNTRSQTKVD